MRRGGLGWETGKGDVRQKWGRERARERERTSGGGGGGWAKTVGLCSTGESHKTAMSYLSGCAAWEFTSIISRPAAFSLLPLPHQQIYLNQCGAAAPEQCEKMCHIYTHTHTHTHSYGEGWRGSVRVHVCVCVCVRERELTHTRERESERDRKRD